MENPPEDKEEDHYLLQQDESAGISQKNCRSRDMKHTAWKGGYVGWLMADMKKKEADDVCEHVELSIRKGDKRRSGSKFTKAVREYELVKEGDRIAVCISRWKRFNADGKAFPELKRRNKFNFEVKFLVMDLRIQSGEPGRSVLRRKCKEDEFRSRSLNPIFLNRYLRLKNHRVISVQG